MAVEDLYRKRKCELCGAYAFEKNLGTAKVLDGGFTKIENWECSGFGSIVINFWEFRRLENSRIEMSLCSECAEKIDKAIYDAMRKLKKEGQDGK